jgi:transcriptional antiterminator RfaH
MEITALEPWYLVQVRPNSTARAARNLLRQGFSVFSPKIERTAKRCNSFYTQTRPLFSGYIFVQTHQNPLAWRSINGTFGVSRLVRFGDSFPKPVPEQFMAAIIARCDGDGVIKPTIGLKTGDTVKVLSGPFADFVLKVEKLDDQERVWAMIDFLGEQTRVSFGKENLLLVADSIS